MQHGAGYFLNTLILSGFFLAVLLACVLPRQASAAGDGADGTADRADPGSAKPTKQLTYKEIGGKSLALYVFEPAGHKAADKRPAAVFFHGGGWRVGSPNQFFWQGAYLASRGMIAFSVQYRLKPDGAKVTDCIEDAKDAVRYVRAHAAELGIDPEKIAVGGGSAGGHLAAACAVVPDAGAKDAASAMPNLLLLFNPALFHKLADGTLELKQFTKETPPAIFFLGTKDEMLAYAQNCLEQSKKLGNTVKLYTAEGEGHGFFNGGPWRERTALLMDQFLAQHGYLKGEPTVQPPAGAQMQEQK